VPTVDTDPSSGKEMFQTFCAVCHGPDARGGGPAVAALKKAPADRILLTKNAGGKFPGLRVYDVIRGDVGFDAHESKDMPVWGRVFRSMSHSDLQTQQRIASLQR
jgi:mono/diheme cytochrome c family protein